MKRVYALCMLTSLALILLSFGFHEMTKKPEKHLKVGFILVGQTYGKCFPARCHPEHWPGLWRPD